MKTKYTYFSGIIVTVFIIFHFMANSQTPDEEAKLHYKQAVTLFQEGNYNAALAEFKKSYELKPNWKIKISIGICYFNLNKFVDAQKTLLEYLEEGGEQVPQDKKAQANDLLSQISKLVAEMKIEANIDGARVLLNGKDIGKTPIKPFVVEAGLYKISIIADGYQTYEKEVTVAGGESKSLDVTLIPIEVKKVEEKKVEEKTTLEPSVKVGEGEKVEVKSESGEKTSGKEGEKVKGKKLSGLAIGAIVSGVLAAGAWGGAVGLGMKVKNMEDEYNKCPAGPGGDNCREKNDGSTYVNILNFAMIPLASVLSVVSISLGVVAGVKGKKAKEKEKNSKISSVNFSLAPIFSDHSSALLTVSGQF